MKLKYIILFILIFSKINFAQPENLLQQGNKFYQKGNYQKAVEVYSKLVNEGYESEELFFNLGNAYYRLNQIGYAILNYEKALKLSPGDEDAKYNLAIAHAKTKDKIEVMPKPFFTEWWHSFINLFSVSGWTILTYIFYLIFLSSIALYFFAREIKIQKYSFFSSLILGGIFFFTAFMLLMKLNYENNFHFGIVVENSAAAKLSPYENSNDAFIIHEGTKVTLEDKVDNWIKIKLPDGKVGWLQNTEVKSI